MAKIGEFARQAGISTKTIGYYKTIGVLPEPQLRPRRRRPALLLPIRWILNLCATPVEKGEMGTQITQI